MANLYIVKVATQANKEIKVVANSPEEAQTKVPLQEGESVVEVQDHGDVVA